MKIFTRGHVLALLVWSGCSYHAGSFEFIWKSYPTGKVSAGCLDVGVGAHRASRDDAPVVMYALGNRCAAPTVVDLRAVRAWGVVVSGERVALVPHDPRRELGPRTIASSWAGSAAIEYMSAERGVRPIFVEVCVELAGIVPELTGFERCFDPRVGGAS